jgi:hypothetical protein
MPVWRPGAWLQKLLCLCLAACVGLLVASAFMVAPAAFTVLRHDPVSAGQIAGTVFEWTYSTCALVAFCAATADFGKGGQKPVALLAAGCVAVALRLGIAPLVLNHGAGWPYSFDSLHHLAAAVHAVLLAILIYAVWQRLGEPTGRPVQKR